MTWQHRTPKAHNPQTSVLESVSDADRVYQHISQLTKHGLGQLQSSGFYLNRFACPKHGGDDANASLHNHGFLYCHSHCGEIPLNEVKGLLGIHGSAPGSTHHITSPDTRPTNVQHKRTSKHSLHDHAQWSAYLQGRHILEPAIAAGAWIEYSDYYGRNCLVWHEKRRDGSRGAGRRRFINPPVINGRQYGKSIWFDGEKTDEPFHYVGTLDELKRAIAGASGELNIVEGETDVWSMHAMGLPNTVGIYGISNIPPDIASILAELDVTKFVYYATMMTPVSGAPLNYGRCFMNQAGEAKVNIASSPDQAYPRRATPTTCYATTIQIYRLLVPPWMRYPALCPA